MVGRSCALPCHKLSLHGQSVVWSYLPTYDCWRTIGLTDWPTAAIPPAFINQPTTTFAHSIYSLLKTIPYIIVRPTSYQTITKPVLIATLIWILAACGLHDCGPFHVYLHMYNLVGSDSISFTFWTRHLLLETNKPIAQWITLMAVEMINNQLIRALV